MSLNIYSIIFLYETQDILNVRFNDLKEDYLLKRWVLNNQGKLVCGQKYVIDSKIGQGTFGEVYIEVSDECDQTLKEVAIKIQSEVSTKNPQLINQAENLKIFNENNENLDGFPKIHGYGIESGYSYMVLDLLGPNLQDLMMLCDGRFSIKTTILLGLQVFQRIKSIHSKGYVYRDIKPENFIMGIGTNSQTVYVVDFGLCKKYRDEITQLHYPYRQDRTITGTVRYTSINSHLGVEQSRRDDLQAICYMLIYFIKGRLPWQGIKGQLKMEKEHVIMQRKLKITTQQLCSQLPYQFNNLVNYCRDLSYYDDPDYSFIFGELNTLYTRLGWMMNYNYDWVLYAEKKTYQTTFIKIELGKDVSDNFNECQQQLSAQKSQQQQSEVQDEIQRQESQRQEIQRQELSQKKQKLQYISKFFV